MRPTLATFAAVLVLATTLSAASVDGLAIHSSATGAGKTIAFVHGWTCDSSSWDAQVPVFAKNYHVVTLDLPGHGRSGSPKDGTFSMDLFARAVEAVRAESGADQIVLVGHSMGAPVIREYARLYPQHVAALVAVDGPLDMRDFAPRAGQMPPPMIGPEGLKAREQMIRGMFTPQTPRAVQDRVMSMMMAAPEATANGAMVAMFDPALRSADVTPMPALTVYAGTGQVPDTAEVQKVLPRWEAMQIAGTGHFVMMEKPDEFNRALTAFLHRIKF